MPSPVVIVTTISLLLALLAMIYALTCWRQRNMKYFAFLTIAVAINVLGYFLEVTSNTLEAAIVACKVAYMGVPFTGLLLLQFSMDYSTGMNLSRPLRAGLYLLGASFSIAVFLYPDIPLFYENLSFSTEGLVNHLVVTPGPLYYPCIIYGSLFTILAIVNLVASFIREKRYEGIIIFIIAVILPLFAQFYTMLFGLIDGWNPQRTALALSVVFLAFYLARYKQARWQSTGRELVVQEMDDGFILLDNKGTVIDHNEAAEKFFSVLGQRKRRLKIDEVWQHSPIEYLEYGVHHMDIQKGGEVINFKITTSPLVAEGETTGTLIVINDDTANNKMLKELTRMARIDELTGLNNRATFFNDATISFNLAKREESNKGCALMLDIDYFKNVNDTYGHAVGDEVLRYIGHMLINRFRHTDICGRYGGEELSIWMPATSLEGSIKVAEEIRSLVEDHVFDAEGTTFKVTVSIGIACMRSLEIHTFDELMKKADFALYEAKHSGRNRVCVYKAER